MPPRKKTEASQAASSHTTDLIEQMNRYYEARAPWHDYYMSYTSIEKMEALLRPIVDIVEPIVTGRAVLEIACGTGNWTQALAKRAASVTATDISPTALGIARQKLSGYDNVTLIEGDAYHPENIDGAFDILFSADWWSHIPKARISDFLASIAKKLAPGSKAVFVDMSLTPYFEQEPCRYDSDSNRISLRKLPDGTPFEVVKNFPSEEELRTGLAHYSTNIDYFDFAALARWMVVFEKN